MANVTIKYKDSVIAEMSESGSKTLNTSGCYCEGDIQLAYTPRSRTYEITLPKSSGWVLLTELDDDVLAHINDQAFTVTLVRISPWEYEYYSGDAYFCTNNKHGVFFSHTIYGFANRYQSETNTSISAICHPANNTEDVWISGELGKFRVDGSKYYIKPSDGCICAGTYRLTFSW